MGNCCSKKHLEYDEESLVEDFLRFVFFFNFARYMQILCSRLKLVAREIQAKRKSHFRPSLKSMIVMITRPMLTSTMSFYSMFVSFFASSSENVRFLTLAQKLSADSVPLLKDTARG